MPVRVRQADAPRRRADAAKEEGPQEADTVMSDDIETLRAEVDKLRRELTRAYENNKRRNVELDALYYVWCDGGCGGGVQRYRNRITFVTKPNDDSLITCAYCKLPSCDLYFETVGGGTHAWHGVHSRCLPALQPVDEEIVQAAIRNTERLARWYGNREYRAKWDQLSGEEKNILLDALTKLQDAKKARDDAVGACRAALAYLSERHDVNTVVDKLRDVVQKAEK